MLPLSHRLPRQLVSNLAKYLGIFVLIAFVVSFVSGYLMASESITRLLDELPEKYNMEDGRVTVVNKLTKQQVEAAEEGEFSWLDRLSLALADEDASDLDDYERLTLYELFCHDVEAVVPDDAMETSGDITMRLYKQRESINLAAIHEGRMPESASEIAIDPTFARNHGVTCGDTIELAGREFTVTGLITLPDYTTLFEKNTDFVMDDLTFCIGVLTDEGYDAFSDCSETYTYGFVFDDPDLTLAERTQAESNLVRALVLSDASVTDLIDIDSNQGYTFSLDDAEGDATMYRIFFYLIMVMMAFIFVVITGANIEAESSVIGTLLASGYGKGELLRHYLVLPTLVAVAAVVVGNATQGIFCDWTREVYYNSYSLPPFELFWDQAVFVQTSVLPVVLLVVITVVGLRSKLKHTPLAFLRHETSRTHRGRGVQLPAQLPFFSRFRLRVALNNLGNIATIFIGIFIAGVILLMGLGMMPVVQDVAAKMADSLPAEHVYTMRTAAEVPAEDADVADQAEKLELASVEVPKKWDWGPLKVTVYGIEESSRYWSDDDVTDGKVVIGGGVAQKCDLAAGDEMTMTDPYEDKTYAVSVAAVTSNATDTGIYMSRETLNDLVGNDVDDFNGWASDEALHFDESEVLTDLTPSDMSKMADQMESSMGNIMQVFVAAALVVFVVVVFLLSKTIMERSSRAVSQLKVFGYTDGELSRVYVRSVTVAVAVALVATIPLIVVALTVLMEVACMDYNVVFEINIPVAVYAEYVGLGFASYAVVALLNKVHLRRVSLSLALKSQE